MWRINLKKSNHSGDLGVDVMLLKWILKKQGVDWIYLAQCREK